QRQLGLRLDLDLRRGAGDGREQEEGCPPHASVIARRWGHLDVIAPWHPPPTTPMRIKRVEVIGFKSFCDRAVVEIGEQITAVVGPNGCGKSNIVDAIRWCMGEQSAKHLRGGAMQDVIFAGSDSRGPLGMCDVTLVFENDGRVPIEYLAYSEIAVTRKLYRD